MTPEEEFKERAKRILSGYTKGAKDQSGNEIISIFLRADEFVIYEIESKNLVDSIRIAIEPWTKEDKNGRESNYFKIRAKYIEVKGLLYKVVDDSSVKSRIAPILALAINGSIEEAEKQLDDLINEINTVYRNQFRNRLRYLGTVLTFVAFCILLSILTYNLNLFHCKPINRHLIFVVTAGTIGGFISVSRRIRQMVFEKDVDWYLYLFYGFERAIISSFSAVIAYFIIQSNLALGIINELSKPMYGALVFAFVAGFSETLIPNLLIKLEKENS
ncbi:hypothetical protein [uncultured Imperialibacter sp.]|uniref:hypothetical protein n=1 Tax=uncultured Imperialibacter sp. TaxID=1672639 RepID=UPI0030DAD5B6|tara:strand:+ start:23437 stop:24258 length:822 start_codon:yes stop_codon:yes gene_type:complete